MDYEYKHKEEIVRATQLWECGDITRENLEYIFPELKESEDERIRKSLIEHLQCDIDDMNKSDCPFDFEAEIEELSKYIAWLEKQGEQKSVNIVEPKFNVGDWVATSYGKINQVITVDKDGDGFTLDDDTYFSGCWKDGYHLWTIADAKDGDVLSAHECIVVFKEIDGLNIKCHCTYHYMNNPSFYVDTLQNKTAFHPATKDQRDLLFSKMKEAGFVWDAKKKELRKIENFPILSNSAKTGKNWSEEDEKCIDNCCLLIGAADNCYEKTFKDDCIHYLQNLKQRMAQ